VKKALALFLVISLLALPSASYAGQTNGSKPKGQRGTSDSGHRVTVSSLPENGTAARSGQGRRSTRRFMPADERQFKEVKEGKRTTGARGTAVRESALRAPGDVQPASTTLVETGFDALAESGWIPSDVSVAISNATGAAIVEVVNSRIATYTRGGSLQSGPSSLQSFFSATGVTRDPFLPRVIYRNGHFFLVALDSPADVNESALLVAASQTNNPTGAWCVFAIDARTNNNATWADWPAIGATDEHFFVSTNQFNFSDDEFVHSNLYVFDQDELTANPCDTQLSFVEWSNLNNPTSPETPVFSLQPVLDYDATDTAAYLVAARDPGSGLESAVTVFRMNNPAAGVNATFNSYTVDTFDYGLPDNAPQPGTSAQIFTGDTRLTNAVKKYNVIWTSHPTGLTEGNSDWVGIHWMAINAPPSNSEAATLQQQNYYHAGPGEFFYGPSITPDRFGAALMGFNRSTGTVSPEVRITSRELHEPVGFFSPSVLSQGTSGFIETGGQFSGTSLTLDPNNQRKVYVAGQYVKGNDLWGTHIRRTSISPVTLPPGF
jgi:hypothetical protein